MLMQRGYEPGTTRFLDSVEELYLDDTQECIFVTADHPKLNVRTTLTALNFSDFTRLKNAGDVPECKQWVGRVTNRTIHRNRTWARLKNMGLKKILDEAVCASFRVDHWFYDAPIAPDDAIVPDENPSTAPGIGTILAGVFPDYPPPSYQEEASNPPPFFKPPVVIAVSPPFIAPSFSPGAVVGSSPLRLEKPVTTPQSQAFLAPPPDDTLVSDTETVAKTPVPTPPETPAARLSRKQKESQEKKQQMAAKKKQRQEQAGEVAHAEQPQDAGETSAEEDATSSQQSLADKLAAFIGAGLVLRHKAKHCAGQNDEPGLPKTGLFKSSKRLDSEHCDGQGDGPTLRDTTSLTKTALSLSHPSKRPESSTTDPETEINCNPARDNAKAKRKEKEQRRKESRRAEKAKEEEAKRCAEEEKARKREEERRKAEERLIREVEQRLLEDRQRWAEQTRRREKEDTRRQLQRAEEVSRQLQQVAEAARRQRQQAEEEAGSRALQSARATQPARVSPQSLRSTSGHEQKDPSGSQLKDSNDGVNNQAQRSGTEPKAESKDTLKADHSTPDPPVGGGKQQDQSTPSSQLQISTQALPARKDAPSQTYQVTSQRQPQCHPQLQLQTQQTETPFRPQAQVPIGTSIASVPRPLSSGGHLPTPDINSKPKPEAPTISTASEGAKSPAQPDRLPPTNRGAIVKAIAQPSEIVAKTIADEETNAPAQPSQLELDAVEIIAKLHVATTAEAPTPLDHPGRPSPCSTIRSMARPVQAADPPLRAQQRTTPPSAPSPAEDSIPRPATTPSPRARRPAPILSPRRRRFLIPRRHLPTHLRLRLRLRLRRLVTHETRRIIARDLPRLVAAKVQRMREADLGDLNARADRLMVERLIEDSCWERERRYNYRDCGRGRSASVTVGEGDGRMWEWGVDRFGPRGGLEEKLEVWEGWGVKGVKSHEEVVEGQDGWEVEN